MAAISKSHKKTALTYLVNRRTDILPAAGKYPGPHVPKLTVQKSPARQEMNEPAVGFIMPFHPCIGGRAPIRSRWESMAVSAIAMARRHYLHGTVLLLEHHLKNTFGKLDFNAHCKSVAVIVTPAGEKIYYQNMEATCPPVVMRGLHVTDLFYSATSAPAFFYILFVENTWYLYEYHHEQILQLYKKAGDPGGDIAAREIAAVLELLNAQQDRPVFTGGFSGNANPFRNHKINQTFIGHTVKCCQRSGDGAASLLHGVVAAWPLLEQKYLRRLLLSARESGTLVTNVTAVADMLDAGKEGILFISGNYRQTLRSLLLKENEQQRLLAATEKFVGPGNIIAFLRPAPGMLLPAIGFQPVSRPIEDYTARYHKNSPADTLLF